MAIKSFNLMCCLFAIVLLILCSCAKAPQLRAPIKFKTSIIIDKFCDEPPTRIVDQILRTTHNDCVMDGYDGVAMVTICHRKATDVTGVSYKCGMRR